MHILTGGSDDSEDPPTQPTPMSSEAAPALKPLEELLAGSPDEEDSLGRSRSLLEAQLPSAGMGAAHEDPTTGPTHRGQARPGSAPVMDDETPRTHRGPLADLVNTPSLDDLRRSQSSDPTRPPTLWSRIRSWLGL